MVYVPHTEAERHEMLAVIGVESMEELFLDIPAAHRYPQLELPEPLSELEVMQELQELSTASLNANEVPTFLGAGAYRHWVPSVVNHIIGRSEFATAYTPYQPEISQGTLQAIFEYQSLICDLTGMEVANASHYDGATATAEAVIQAVSASRMKRKKIIVSPHVNPQYRQVIHTYTQGMGLEIVGEATSGALAELVQLVDKQTACLIVQSPNFLGELESLEGLAAEVHARNKKTLLAVATNPLSLGLFTPPGAYGADIVLGEGQPLGLGLNFGGPYLGFYATKSKYTRNLAGRLVGQAVDEDGQRGYVLTLSTREQHIRRERATSNICSNQGLMALAAAVYLSTLGKDGVRKVAELNYQKAHYAAQQIDTLATFSVLTTKPFFNEFVVQCPAPAAEINEFLLNGWMFDIIGGYDLSEDYPDRQNQLLLAVTEMNSRTEIDDLVHALAEFEAHRISGGDHE
ncbi:MAG: aminomethyl-transferring glycine dehydrogenase subunit GcvPA [Anaerolineae bacterium]|nr:aminomethyl-transferring glycine dehydrogenase subunit GcvPA [Anaerolineae bacterium]